VIVAALGAGAATWLTAQPTPPAAHDPAVAAPGQADATDRPPVAPAGRATDDCPVRDETVTVRGHSLAPLVPAGSRLAARFGYYRCHAVRRGDLVYYAHAGGSQAVAKVVKAVPGDRLSLAEVDGDLRLLVNQQPARTSTGQHYHLDRRARRMLAPYVTSHGGVVPESAYLLLSDRNERVLDGRHFGLVHHDDLLARLELP
jgi:signal peptidase I